MGGDWYDVFALDDTHVALVIADVAGHGHSAAIFMVQVRNVFRAIAAEHTEPADVLMRANNVTDTAERARRAVRDVLFRSARHLRAHVEDGPRRATSRRCSSWPTAPPAYLDERPGAPLAFFEGEHYESSSIEVRPGDRIVMFTDGMVERRREHLDTGLARLSDLAASHAPLSPQEFVTTLAASVTGRYDDLALVCVDFLGVDLAAD